MWEISRSLAFDKATFFCFDIFFTKTPLVVEKIFAHVMKINKEKPISIEILCVLFSHKASHYHLVLDLLQQRNGSN